MKSASYTYQSGNHPMSPQPLSDLLCNEKSSQLFAGNEELPEDIDELMAQLVVEEKHYCPDSQYRTRLSSGEFPASPREEAIAWILKVHGYHHFRPLTAYLSINYMDRFLALHNLPQASKGWPMQLLSVASLSLAAKMEETRIPSLLDLQVEGAKFIFEPRTVYRMEVLVLNAIDWRLRSVTPFDFIDFFAFKIDPSGVSARFLASVATQIILSTIHETKFLDQWPSSVAAAAIICAADSLPNLSLVCPQDAVSWCAGLNKEKIVSCYKLLQQLVVSSSNRIMGKYNKAAKVIPEIRLTRAIIHETQEESGESNSSISPRCSSHKKRKLNNSLWVYDNNINSCPDKNSSNYEDEKP